MSCAVLTGLQTNFEHFLQKHRDGYEDNDLNIILISPVLHHIEAVEVSASWINNVTKLGRNSGWKKTVEESICMLHFSFTEGTGSVVPYQPERASMLLKWPFSMGFEPRVFYEVQRHSESPSDCISFPRIFMSFLCQFYFFYDTAVLFKWYIP